MNLRDYQRDVIDSFVAEIERGHRRIILVAPTGSGKTVIASEIVRRYVFAPGHVLFMAHRRELITQAQERLHAFGIDSGTILAGFPPRPHVAVQVASVQTLWSRAFKGRSVQLPAADLVVVDEAHHARAQTYRKIIDSYPKAVILGLTATPCRGDGRGLGNIFEALVQCPQIGDLVKAGHLVPSRVFAPVTPNLAGVQVRQGDYVEAQLSRRVNTDRLVCDIVSHWHRLADGRRTIAFSVDVAHSIHIRDEFPQSGVVAEHIEGSTPKDERDAILARLACGEVQVVSNCMLAA
jgi:DNA repair protein RadD